MLIRSQDGCGITNFKNVLALYIDDFFGNYSGYQIKIFVSACNSLVLGEYETEERCKEILADICEQYTRFLNFPGAEGNTVFQMPEE